MNNAVSILPEYFLNYFSDSEETINIHMKLDIVKTRYKGIPIKSCTIDCEVSPK